MLFPMILLIITNTCVSSNVGSILFYNRNLRDCWSDDDLALLRARRVFENLAPLPVSPDKINSRYIRETLRYFRKALGSVQKDVDGHTAVILKEALADTIGGHLRSELLPTVRFAYYAGYVPFRNAMQLHSFFDEVKRSLNTQGMGWKEPDKRIQWSNLTVGRILIGTSKFADPCTGLIAKRDSDACMHLPSPKLDDEYKPSAIALPFRIGGLVSLSSPSSENILLKYYTSASRCILTKSPKKCRHSDFVNFNNELWHWMKRDVAPHLIDENLYAAYGGVLRIAAAVQHYGKGLSRRNLFDYEGINDGKWNPWRALTQSTIHINTDWSAKLYVFFVILAVVTICLLQMCYGYIFGSSGGCHCSTRKSDKFGKEVAYANVASISKLHSDGKRVASSKSAYVGNFKTERVYDLNENTEKMMPVIMSTETCSSSSGESDQECIDNTVVEARPPEIETPIAQLKIAKAKARMPLNSTSISRSEMTCCRETPISDTVWSESVSSSSGGSGSSSSKSHTRGSRETRNLAWARRVISRHSARSQTSKD